MISILKEKKNEQIFCPVYLIICYVNVGFDGVIRIENEISSIPADYAQRHIQAEQSRD
jgi:hypothetical protein